MDDLQFKKQLEVTPLLLDDDMLAYVEAHPELKKMVYKTRSFNSQIERALDIDVPEGLEARILLNQSYLVSEEANASHGFNEGECAESGALPSSEANSLSEVDLKIKTYSWWGLGGLAASLMVGVISFNLWKGPADFTPLKATDIVAHIIDHMAHDSELMTAFKVPKTENDLQKLFLAVGASIEHPIEQMSYAGECVVNGQKGLHIVLQEAQGPVTVIVIPGQQLTALEAFQASGYQGELVPVKGGVVAIVAHNHEQVAQAHMRFFKAVKFV